MGPSLSDVEPGLLVIVPIANEVLMQIPKNSLTILVFGEGRDGTPFPVSPEQASDPSLAVMPRGTKGEGLDFIEGRAKELRRPETDQFDLNPVE